MSGTSLDGLDIAYCKFEKKGSWEFETIAAITYLYPKEWRQKLEQAIDLPEDKLAKLDTEYGKYIAEKVNGFIEKNHLSPDLICSHGHTVFHQPEKGITRQIGSGEEIAGTTGIPTIYDFRTKDVILGGQGAPLVPVGDKHLFSEYDYCINLGGFANISYDDNGVRKAYDICPVNMALNEWAKALDMEYDESGKIASLGNLNEPLLRALNEIPFYDLAPPKSLGREWYSSEFQSIMQRSGIPIPDKLRTITEHINVQILKQLTPNKKVLVTGGGAYNTFLMERISNAYKGEILVPARKIIDFKEAIIFAFLGTLRYRSEVNCLASVTGATENSSSGEIANPSLVRSW